MDEAAFNPIDATMNPPAMFATCPSWLKPRESLLVFSATVLKTLLA
ncbi:MAG: hypothetical protein QXN08_01205 [Nitrososphaerales archaeon]